MLKEFENEIFHNLWYVPFITKRIIGLTILMKVKYNNEKFRTSP